MNKTTMLFIRACKSNTYNDRRTTDARIESVYRRFYLSGFDIPKAALISILADIVEDFDLLTVTNLITRLDPNYVFSYDENYSYIDRCYNTMVTVIRHAEKSKFPDLISPRKFRIPRDTGVRF